MNTNAPPSIESRTALPSEAALVDRGVWRGSIGLTVLALGGFGFLYALAGVGVGQALFPDSANGSVIERDGKIVGSELVAQAFSDDKYFHPRPSAAGYDLMALAGSNGARTDSVLRNRLNEARAAIAQREGVEESGVPRDLFSQSGSGIDPHISPEAAAIQVPRVARTRGLPALVLEQLIAGYTDGKQLGVLGQPRVNVLLLNLALDEMALAATTRAPDEEAISGLSSS